MNTLDIAQSREGVSEEITKCALLNKNVFFFVVNVCPCIKCHSSAVLPLEQS